MVRQFIIFTQKEFYHIFRDRWTMLMLLALPILMIVLFGFGISTEIKNAQFVVLDNSDDHVTQKLIEKLNSSEFFTLEGYAKSESEIDEAFNRGKIGLALIFGPSFSQSILHTGEAQIMIIADGTDPNTASTLTNYASSIIRGYLQSIQNQPMPLAIHTEVQLRYNPTMKGAYNTVPGVIGMVLMLICAMMTSVSIAREKEIGTMEVLLVSPLHPLLIILSKVVPYFVISIVNLANVLLIAHYALEVPINGSLSLVLFISLLFIFVSLALGLIISSVTDRQMVALLISAMGLMMPVVMLSGLMFPIENMPWALQVIAQVIPAKWYIVAMRDVMIKGVGFMDVIKEISVLSLMALVLIGASLKRFKIRLE